MKHSRAVWAGAAMLLVFGGLGCDEPAPRKSPPQPAVTAPVKARPAAAVGLRIVRTPEPGPVTFAGGELTELVLVVSAVELHLCEDASLWDLVVPTAHAHVPSSATRLGTPVAVDLLSGNGFAKIAGEVAPPRGRYCRGWAILAPADDDVLNFSNVDTVELEGATMVLRTTTAAPFVWKGARAIPFDVVNPATGDVGLDLSKDGAHAQILVEMTIDTSRVAGVLADGIDDSSAEALVEDMAAHTRMYRWSRDGEE